MFIIKYLLKMLKYWLLLVPFLKHQNAGLVSAACTSIGVLGKSHSLPLDNGKPLKSGSPNAKRPAIEMFTKMDIVKMLLDVMNNTKLFAKTREEAAKSLGLLCIGEIFPHTQEVLQGLLNTAKQVINFQIVYLLNLVPIS